MVTTLWPTAELLHVCLEAKLSIDYTAYERKQDIKIEIVFVKVINPFKNHSNPIDAVVMPGPNGQIHKLRRGKIYRLLSNFVASTIETGLLSLVGHLLWPMSNSQIMHSKCDDEDFEGLFKFTYAASGKPTYKSALCDWIADLVTSTRFESTFAPLGKCDRSYNDASKSKAHEQ